MSELVHSCSRPPEEPAPTKFMRENTKVSPSITTAKNEKIETVACPHDPDPNQGRSFYQRGQLAFVTSDQQRHEFQVDIARTESARERGLMYRTSLASNDGMFFEFNEPHQAIFWMRNTCIALDMIFIDSNLRVLGVVTAPPLNDEPRGVPGLTKYVVELAAGTANAKRIKAGDTLILPKE